MRLAGLFLLCSILATAAVAAEPVSRGELLLEAREKVARVQRLAASRGLAGVLISQVRNFSWVTAGIADNHVVITSEMGAASLLVMADGRRYLVASNSEVPRLTSEDL